MAKPGRRRNKRRKQARSGLAPAASLPTDIVWKIIDIISRGRSSDPGHHQITYIRHISQVCRLWREVTLQSTSVWGNMMDINFLSRASEEWKSEIMRRTGRAGLSISGSLVPIRHAVAPTLVETPNLAVPILVNLLEHDWERVVALRLVFRKFEEGPLRDVLKIFWTKPALILEEFSITCMSNYGEPVSLPPGAVIFLDNAPHLRSFCWQHLHSDLRAGWVNQLSQMYLPKACSVQRALDIIRECPRLQKLTYDSHIVHSAGLVQQNVNLPELRSLNLKAEVTACSDLLTYITPHPTCLLKMDVRQVDRVTSQDMKVLQPLLSLYLDACFDHPDRRHRLHFEYDDEVYCYLAVESKNRAVVTKLGFGTDQREEESADLWIPETLLDAVSVRNLDSVVAFRCTSEPLLRTINSRLLPLLSKFPKLQRLEIPDHILESIVKDKIYLPRSLKSVGFTSSYDDLSFNTRLKLILSLLRRLRRGVTLDITLHFVGDWRALDKVRGLKVVWRMGKRYGNDNYTCGTGHPEKLLIN